MWQTTTRHAYTLDPAKLDGVGWLCRPDTLWEPIRETSSHASHQEMLIYSHLSLLSHCGLILGLKEWNCCCASWSPLKRTNREGGVQEKHIFGMICWTFPHDTHVGGQSHKQSTSAKLSTFLFAGWARWCRHWWRARTTWCDGKELASFRSYLSIDCCPGLVKSPVGWLSPNWVNCPLGWLYPDGVNCPVGWLYPDGMNCAVRWLDPDQVICSGMTLCRWDELCFGMTSTWLGELSSWMTYFNGVKCPVEWLYPDWVNFPVEWLLSRFGELSNGMFHSE